MNELNAEISYLKEYIKPGESIEGYGEANHAVQPRDRVPSVSGKHENSILSSIKTNFSSILRYQILGTLQDEDPLSESDVIYESEGYCVKCDKVKREARKEIEDLLLQVRLWLHAIESLSFRV